MTIKIGGILPLQLLQTRQELWITNNLPAASVFTHVCQMPIGIDDQRGHGGNWRRLVDGDAPSSDPPSLRPLSAQAQSDEQTRQWWQPPGQHSSMEGAMDWHLSIRVTKQQGKDRALSLIHISEPTRRYAISYAVF